MANNINIKGATVMAMGSLALSAYSLFVPPIEDIKHADTADRDMREKLDLGEAMSIMAVLTTAGFATYVTGNWEVIAVGIIMLALLYFGYHYAYERLY